MPTATTSPTCTSSRSPATAEREADQPKICAAMSDNHARALTLTVSR